MVPSIGAVAFVSVSFLNAVKAIPTPQSIGSDLTILTHNDLYGSSSLRQAAVVVLGKRQSLEQSLAGCAHLGESLWTPSNSTQDLSFLRYLDHDKITDELGVYWISSQNGTECRAVDTGGHIQNVDCDVSLPALCSQSAALSKTTGSETDVKWQTSVRTGNATVVGYRDKLSFRFQGIKYASQPQRFGYSKYAAPSGNVSALSYGPSCVQSACGDTLPCSEDCLSLNIWTPYLPASKWSKKKAVMVWIHGGGFTGGTGSDTTFDGGNMASRGDVVVVTINYRLSTLGFLALEGTDLKGNYGLADQNTALDWLRAHIEDFGGDKNRITVFGQSAGAASVRALIASPQTVGKFSGAIMQSNPGGVQYASTFSQYLTIKEATDLTKAILTETGCTQTDKAEQLSCLREQDALKLVGWRNGSWSGTIARYPVVDGSYLTDHGLLLQDGAARKNVTVMAGVMRDDGAPFSRFSSSSNASEALNEQGFNAADILGSNIFSIGQSGNRTIDIFNLTSRVATDAMFRCLGQSTAFAGSENGIFPSIYSYEFDRGYQISEWSPNSPTCEAPATSERPLGDVRRPYFKCHSGELYYVFGTLIRQGRPPRDEDDIPFSQYVVDTWTAFGRQGNPNPALGFLHARGFTNTSKSIEASRPWEPVQAGKNSSALRILDKVTRDEQFRELEQCNVLNLPLNFYLS